MHILICQGYLKRHTSIQVPSMTGCNAALNFSFLRGYRFPNIKNEWYLVAFKTSRDMRPRPGRSTEMSRYLEKLHCGDVECETYMLITESSVAMTLIPKMY